MSENLNNKFSKMQVSSNGQNSSKAQDISNYNVMQYSEKTVDVVKLCIFTDDAHYRSNYSMIEEKDRKDNFFIFQWNTERDLSMAKSEFSSLETFSKHSPNFIIRTFIPGFKNMESCVFTDDILQIIPLALKKQGKKTESFHEKLESYRKEWATTNENMTRVIEVEKFKKILKEFGVNESRITIIKDLIHDHTSWQAINEGLAPIYTLNPQGKSVMVPQQAMFYLFQSTVCGVNWFTEKCKKNKEAIQNFKAMVDSEMTKLMELDNKGLLISKDYIDQQISQLQNHQIFTNKIVTQTSDYLLNGLTVDDYIPTSLHKKLWSDLGFEENDDAEGPMSPAPGTRSLIIFETIQLFLEKRMLEKQLALVEALSFKVPLHLRDMLRDGMRSTAQMAHIEWVEQGSKK